MRIEEHICLVFSKHIETDNNIFDKLIDEEILNFMPFFEPDYICLMEQGIADRYYNGANG